MLFSKFFVFHVFIANIEISIDEVMISTPPQNRSAPLFESVTFECTAFGNRRPSIIWMRQDGTEPRGTISTNPSENSITSTLTIRNIMSSDFTSYSCRAENIAAENIIETIRVVVFANFTLYRAGKFISHSI